MSKTTGTPVNTVIFDASLSLVTGLLVFAGPQAINAVFAISVTALYVAYAIPIVARCISLLLHLIVVQTSSIPP
jgi:amino acid transporter